MRAKTKKKHEMGKRFAIVIGVAAALLAGLAGLAIANSTSGPEKTAKSVSDPEGDDPGDNCPPTNGVYCEKSYDFVKVSAGRMAAGSLLVFTAKVRGKAKWVPELSISTDKAKDCEYYVGRDTVVNCDTGAEAPAKYVGKAGERGFKFVFSPDSIGNPNKYRWQFAYFADLVVLADEAPNKPDVYPRFGRPCTAAEFEKGCRR